LGCLERMRKWRRPSRGEQFYDSPYTVFTDAQLDW